MNAKFPNFIFLMMALAAISFGAAANSVNGQEQRKIPCRGGDKVVVRNNYGSITITGWDGETLEAVATDTSRGELVPVKVGENQPGSGKIFITTEIDKRFPRNKIKLEVKLPRYVELEPLETESDSITVSGMEGLVNVITGSGDIKIVNAGSVQIRTRTGNIDLENINGRTDLITANGNVNIRQTDGDARIIAFNAKINLSCIKGRVEITDTSSQIWLAGIEGDVDVSTSNGKAYFTGAIRSQNHYRLKTLSGAVSMTIPDETGFTVVLSSYSGQIEKDFDLQNDSASSVGKKERRFTGKFGDGKAQIELDSFDGRVGFRKIAAGVIKGCESTRIKN